MRLSPWLTAAIFASLVSSAAAQGLPTREACEGPFRPCAQTVNATCARDPDGAQRIIFRQAGGKGPMEFERCVGRVYEERGLPNPYKTGTITGDLAFPRAEIIDSDPGYE